MREGITIGLSYEISLLTDHELVMWDRDVAPLISRVDYTSIHYYYVNDNRYDCNFSVRAYLTARRRALSAGFVVSLDRWILAWSYDATSTPLRMKAERLIAKERMKT